MQTQTVGSKKQAVVMISQGQMNQQDSKGSRRGDSKNIRASQKKGTMSGSSQPNSLSPQSTFGQGFQKAKSGLAIDQGTSSVKSGSFVPKSLQGKIFQGGNGAKYRQHSDLANNSGTGSKTDSSVESQNRYPPGSMKQRSSKVSSHMPPSQSIMQTGTFEMSNIGQAVANSGQFTQGVGSAAHGPPGLHQQAYQRATGAQFSKGGAWQQPIQPSYQGQSQSLVMSRNTSPGREKQLKKGSIDFYHINASQMSSQKSLSGGEISQGRAYYDRANLDRSSPLKPQSTLNMRQNYLANISQQSNNSRSPPQQNMHSFPNKESYEQQQQPGTQYIQQKHNYSALANKQGNTGPRNLPIQQLLVQQHSQKSGRQQMASKLVSSMVSPSNSPRNQIISLADSMGQQQSTRAKQNLPVKGTAQISRQTFNNYGLGMSSGNTSQTVRPTVSPPDSSGGPQTIYPQYSENVGLNQHHDPAQALSMTNSAHPNNPSFTIGSSPDQPPNIVFQIGNDLNNQNKKKQFKLVPGQGNMQLQPKKSLKQAQPNSSQMSYQLVSKTNTKVNSRGSSINRPGTGVKIQQQPQSQASSNLQTQKGSKTALNSGIQSKGQLNRGHLISTVASQQQTNYQNQQQVRRPASKSNGSQKQGQNQGRSSHEMIVGNVGNSTQVKPQMLQPQQQQYHQVRENHASPVQGQAPSLQQQQQKLQQDFAQTQHTEAQALLMEQIKNLIKNGKKHFGKDLEQEQNVGQLRDYLLNMTNQLGDMPQAFDSSTIFNQMINDLVKLQFSQEALKNTPGSKGNGPSARAQSLQNSNYTTQKKGQQNGQTSMNTPAHRKLVGQGNSAPNGSKHSIVSNTSSHGSRKSNDSRVQGQGHILKQVKINKPTFNLQINNNVGSVNNTEGGAVTVITKTSTANPPQPQAIDPSAQLSYLNAQKLLEVVQNAAEQQHQQQLAANIKKSKRTSSEDNVNQQMKMQQIRKQVEQEARKKQDQRITNMHGANVTANLQTQNSQGHRRSGAQAFPSGPMGGQNQVKPARKNLPSLANSKSRGNSHSSTNQQTVSGEPQFAVQLRRGNKTSGTNTNNSSYLNSQHASVSKTTGHTSAAPNNQPSMPTTSSQQRKSSNDQHQTSANAVSSGQRSTSQGENNLSGGTQGSRVNTILQVDDSLLKERDELISYIKNYIAKNNELPPTTLEFYKFVKLIGKGAFGKVTLGMHKLTGKSVAIKTIEKQYMKDDFSKRKVFQEVYLLKKIKHSNVIRLLEVFESSKHLLMVMEYAGGGDLLKLIKKRGGLKEQDSKFIFKQIVYGLSHIHCRSVIHRDIKLDNILLDCEKGVKICDFGVSKIIKKGQMIKEQCGTPAYLAPEIIIDTGYEGFFVDIWSLGVLLFAMLSGTVPFKAPTLDELHKLILAGSFTIPDELSQDAKDLMRGMIQLEPSSRLTIPQILGHAWLKETNEMQSESDEEEETKDQNQEAGPPNSDASKGVEGGTGTNKKDGVDMAAIQGNVNYVNVDNLFYHENYKNKLSYIDYCCITEDFTSQVIDEEAIKVCENFGFPRHFMIKCLNRGDINHATACYFLLTNSS